MASIAPTSSISTDQAAKTEPKPEGEDASRPITIAPVIGYATDGLKLGVGVRAGYTVRQGVYFGGAFTYHFGTSAETALGTVSASAFYPGGEVGYDVRLGPVTLRPYAGVAFVVAQTRLGDRSASKESLAAYLGVTLNYTVADSNVFVGADARALVLFSSGNAAFGMFGSAGVRF